LIYLDDHGKVDNMSETPFEGLFGDTPEARLLEHFLAMPRGTFTVRELLEHVAISRPTLMDKLARFVELEVLSEIRSVRPMVFQINSDSDIVRAVNIVNFALIDQIAPGHDFFEMGVEDALPKEHAIELDNLRDRDGTGLPSVRILLDRRTARTLSEVLEDAVRNGSQEHG
jgi:hypothetical protein